VSLLLNIENKDSSLPPDSPVSDDLDRTLVEAAENRVRLARVPARGADQSRNYRNRSGIPPVRRPGGLLWFPFF
jgi:hypothetical protein